MAGWGQIQGFATPGLNGRCRTRKRPILADDLTTGTFEAGTKIPKEIKETLNAALKFIWAEMLS